MSLFSDDRMAELRELFFESARELLQTLNESGLELEKHPDDAEILRAVRRTVHTLKGDSAAVGYRELSELAHQLEDVLTPELSMRQGRAVGEVVLSAADTFDNMLAAYRGNLQPPAGGPLQEMILRLAQPRDTSSAAPTFHPAFAWTEYEQLIIAGAMDQGRRVYNVAASIDPACPMRGAAAQLFRNVLQEAGSVLAMRPEDAAAGDVEFIEAAISSPHPQEWIARRCRVPAVVAELIVQPLVAPPLASSDTAPDVLRILEAPAEPSPAAQPQAELTAAPVDMAEDLATSESAKPEAAHISTPATSDNILRVEAERIDSVLNLMGELIIGKSMLQQAFIEFSNRFAKDPLRNKFADALAFQARVLNDLQRSVMKIRMVPVEQLFRRFPRLVRDVCKQCNKEARLQVTGQDTDLDKSILDALAEPLAHLVRNAVDHGIENAQERSAAGKPACGTVRLNAYHHGNQVIIEISDDGRGIDRQKVVRRAIEQGVISPEEAARLSDYDVLNLIFEAGLSTAEQVTSISGRGVGMDVVRTVLERLKATISIETTPGQGTTFLLKVPLTLAIIKALLFRVGGRLYAVALNSVVEIMRASETDIHRVDEYEVLQLRDQVLTLVRLGNLVHGKCPESKSALFVVVLGIGDRKFGLIVDKLEGEEELVIKALDDKLVATELVSGASILGDGTVVLILNLSAVVERLGRARSQAVHAMAGGTA